MVFMNKISQSSIGHFVCSLAGQVSFWKIIICDTFTKGLFSKIPRHRQSNSTLVHDTSFFNTHVFAVSAFQVKYLRTTNMTMQVTTIPPIRTNLSPAYRKPSGVLYENFATKIIVVCDRSNVFI